MASLPFTGPTDPPTTTDHLSAALSAQQAATEPGMIQVTLPGPVEAEHTVLVTARIYPLGAPSEQAPPGTSLTPQKIPIAPYMAVVLDGSNVTITPNDSRDLVHARRQLLLIGDRHTDWQWRITPHRSAISPLSSEIDHLYFHVYFFDSASDTVGVEVTPPQERNITVLVNPGHSVWHGLSALWGWLGLTGAALLAALFAFLKKGLPSIRARRSRAAEAYVEPVPAPPSAAELGNEHRPTPVRRAHKKPRQHSH